MDVYSAIGMPKICQVLLLYLHLKLSVETLTIVFVKCPYDKDLKVVTRKHRLVWIYSCKRLQQKRVFADLFYARKDIYAMLKQILVKNTKNVHLWA